MEVVEHLEALRREGALLADAASAVELDAPVPHCPGWRVRVLVRHTGGVHRWAAAPPDLHCWSFLPAPSPLAFWARRQAHETAIHRADAQGAGGAVSRHAPPLAADGVDELLLGFASRRNGKLRADPPRTIHLHATDTGADWLVRVEPDRIDVSPEAGDADWSVAGPASDLYLLLWNRRGTDGLQVQGDPALLELWRTSVRVRWS